MDAELGEDFIKGANVVGQTYHSERVQQTNNLSNHCLEGYWRRITSCWGKKGDQRRKHRATYTIAIYFAYTMLGWIRGFFGPSFIELQQICNVGLEQGSWIVTTLYIGYAIGSVAGGIFYDKVNPKLLFGGNLLVLAIMLAITPWCYLYWAMVTVHFIQGITQGVVDTIGNAEILLIWKKSRLVYFGLDLIYGVGSFVSPLITAPFLSDVQHEISTVNLSNWNLTDIPIDVSLINTTFSLNYTISGLTTYATGEEPTTYTNIDSISDFASSFSKSKSLSMLFIPYLLSAGLIFLVAFAFFYIYFRFDKVILAKESTEDTTTALHQGGRKLPRKYKLAALVLISTILFLFVSLNQAFSSYLTVFCVEYLFWTPSDGAVLTSVLNILGIASSTIALFLKCINTMVLSGIYSITLCVSLVGIFFSSLNKSFIGVWISVAIFGYFKTVFFSLLYTWTNEFLTPVTGKISSLYLLLSMVGSSVNPILLGHLMEKHTDLWFCYLFLIEDVFIISLYVIAVLLTRHILSRFGPTYPRESLIVNTQDKFLNTDLE